MIDIHELDSIIKSFIALAKDKAKGEFIFPKTHSKVKDNKDHFPINTEGRGRNALSQASKYIKVPPWYDGSLENLLSTIQRAVKKKYKNIEITDKSKRPGKD